jgi:hypothetical protein
MARRRLTRAERFDVLSRCNFACFYCGVTARLGLVQLEVEHVVPVAQGGTDEPWNLVAACQPCNLGKSDRSPTDAIVQAAIDLYAAWEGRPPRVRICRSCRRPWIPDVDDLEPMDDCWPCVHAWVDGHYAPRTWREERA